MVYREKEETSDVDEREKARYGSSVRSEEIMQKYDFMMDRCRKCISQCENVVFSENAFQIPHELLSSITPNSRWALTTASIASFSSPVQPSNPMLTVESHSSLKLPFA